MSIVTVMSAGSPGKTSFCVNLGIVYAKAHPEKTVLVVDFNFLKPDIATFLDLVNYSKNEMPQSLDNLYPLVAGYQTILLDHYVIKPFKEVPNYYILPGFLNRSHLEDNLDRKQWDHLFSALKEFADFLIFDTDQNLRHSAFQFLFGATDRFLIALDLDPLAIVHARYLVNYLGSRARLGDSKVILLRHERNNPFTDEVKNILGASIDFEVPNIQRKEYEEQIYSAKPVGLNSKHEYTMALDYLIANMEGKEEIVTFERSSRWNNIKAMLKRPFSKKLNDTLTAKNLPISTKEH